MPPKGSGRKPKLTAEDRFMAARLAAMQPFQAIADELQVPVEKVRKLAKREKVKRRVGELQGRFDEQVVRVLRDGEMLAAEYLCELLVDEDAETKYKVAAAITLLDRKGLRGKPVEQTISHMIPHTADEVQKAFQSAMADPGVKAWIQSGGLKELPAGVAEEVIMGSEIVVDQPVP